MTPYSPEKALISLHIFKTGGTSFIDCLKVWFAEGFRFHYLDHSTGAKPHRFPIENPQLAGINVPLCIHGHFDVKAGVSVEDYYSGCRQIVTFFRNPFEAHLSAYYYQKNKFEAGELYYHGEKLTKFPFRDLEYFFETFPSFLLDDFPWELSLENFKDVLGERFIHIGSTETMQRSTDIIADKLGKPRMRVAKKNASDKAELPRDEVRKAFEDKNLLEYAIYDWVQELNS